jgi:hypothetical protein
MLPSDYACPRCKCRACYAVHRKGFDRVISLFGLRPARCLTCGKKFYAHYQVDRKPPAVPQPAANAKPELNKAGSKAA